MLLLELKRCEFEFPTFLTYILTEDILILNENSILHMNLWVIDPKSYDDCNGFFPLSLIRTKQKNERHFWSILV